MHLGKCPYISCLLFANGETTYQIPTNHCCCLEQRDNSTKTFSPTYLRTRDSNYHDYYYHLSVDMWDMSFNLNSDENII